MRVHLPENHPDTTLALANLAAIYFEQKKLALAKPLLLEVLEKKTATLARDDPSIAHTKNNLALLYQSGLFVVICDC